MQANRLTDLIIRAAKTKTGQYTISDSAIPGFGIRISPGGTKSFVVVYGANRRRTTIGKYPVISLSEARAEAKRILAEHTLGNQRFKSISYDDAVDLYLAQCRSRNRPRTVKDYEYMLGRLKFSKCNLSEISQRDIMKKVNALEGKSKTQNYMFVVTRAFFNWAQSNQYIEFNPLSGLKQPNVLSTRERTLTDDELRAIYKHAIQYDHLYSHIIIALIFTGQRKGEISALKWDWIDKCQKIITLPSTITKNGREHSFPYGDVFQKHLSEIPVKNEFVFPATRELFRGKRTTIFNGWGKAKKAFDEGLNVAHYTHHDLRRTFSTKLAQLGTPIHVTEKFLNHVSGSLGGVAGIYNRYSYLDEMREAIGSFEKFVLSS